MLRLTKFNLDTFKFQSLSSGFHNTEEKKIKEDRVWDMSSPAIHF